MLSLDSSVAVEILRSNGSEGARRHFLMAMAGGQKLNISSVVVHELTTGALKTRRPSHHMQVLDDLVGRLEIAEFTDGDALGAARIRADLERAGRSIGPLDILIAGQALARGWTLITADTNHMQRVEGLAVVDWTRADAPDPKENP